MRAKIILVYVIQDEAVPKKYKDTHGDSMPDHYHEDLFERATGEVADMLRKAKVEFEGVYGLGNPTKFILETAKEKDVSFVVVGVHGLHNLNRVRAAGSVARNILESSPVPVIAIPWPEKTKA
jgi:nucleotide-binding universal stress UspA family protein